MFCHFPPICVEIHFRTCLIPPVFFTNRSKAMLLLWILFAIYVSCLAWKPCGHLLGKGLTSWLYCMLCFLEFLSLSHQVWYLIVSIPSLLSSLTKARAIAPEHSLLAHMNCCRRRLHSYQLDESISNLRAFVYAIRVQVPKFRLSRLAMSPFFTDSSNL